MVTITTGYIMKTFVYDIQADKIEELQIPDMPKSVHILGYNSGRIRSFWIPMMMKKRGDEPMPVYIADLDGSNLKVLLEDVPQAGYFFE